MSPSRFRSSANARDAIALKSCAATDGASRSCRRWATSTTGTSRSSTRARARAPTSLILSIFVNPTQFGPNEDLARYPRDLDGDLAKARAAGVDLAFVPRRRAMYPRRLPDVRRGARARRSGLCGARRPGHFAGVATVVAQALPRRRSRTSRSSARRTTSSSRSCAAWRATSTSASRSSACRSCASPTAWRCRRATRTCRPTSAQRALSLSRGLAAAEALSRAASATRDARRRRAAHDRGRAAARRLRRAPRRRDAGARPRRRAPGRAGGRRLRRHDAAHRQPRLSAVTAHRRPFVSLRPGTMRRRRMRASAPHRASSGLRSPHQSIPKAERSAASKDESSS